MAKTIGQLTQATTLAFGDEFVIEQSGLTKRVAASVVRGGLVNADIDAAAAIAFSKLAALDSANILVGNGSNVATKVAVTGDVTISNAGVTAIGNSKVVTAMITDANVTTAKIADANVTPAKLSQPLTLATAQNTTSGTSIDFTGIPSWAKRITVMLNGVSTNGANNLLVQIGDSGGIENTGYVSTAFDRSDETQGTAGFILTSGNAAAIASSGLFICCLVGSNTWVGSSTLSRSDVGGWAAAGTKTLSGTLDRITLTTVNGTDTFDAGSVNIMYEG
jgi:hypothetical protein